MEGGREDVLVAVDVDLAVPGGERCRRGRRGCLLRYGGGDLGVFGIEELVELRRVGGELDPGLGALGDEVALRQRERVA